jgi:hypothetical protein
MSVEAVATRHYRRQVALGRRIAAELGLVWRTRDLADLDGWWLSVAPRLFALLAGAQLLAAQQADTYVDEALEVQDIDPSADGHVAAAAFAGIASDGRPLEGLLYEPVIRVKEAISRGATPTRAASIGRLSLDLIARTQIADAGRAADGAAVVARKQVGGYVRMLSPPSCSRCTILAGRWYRWNAGFTRHPRCDCRHIPTSEDRGDDLRTDPKAYFDSLDRDEQDRIFTAAGAQAIRDGADMGQIVNARRGMRTASIGGRDVLITSEGTTKRGYAAHVRRRVDELEGRGTAYAQRNAGRRGAVQNYIERRTRLPRLMPEQIYRVAETREEAIRLLARNGYLLDVPGRRNSLIRDVAQFASR